MVVFPSALKEAAIFWVFLKEEYDSEFVDDDVAVVASLMSLLFPATIFISIDSVIIFLSLLSLLSSF